MPTSGTFYTVTLLIDDEWIPQQKIKQQKAFSFGVFAPRPSDQQGLCSWAPLALGPSTPLALGHSPQTPSIFLLMYTIPPPILGDWIKS